MVRMAKHRLINTKFRSDSYVMELDPSEKLLFLYYLTNESTDLCWIYELPIRRVSFDTWFDKDMILKIEDRFRKNNKIERYKDWIYVKNFVKNQSKNPSVEKWIKTLIENLPIEIKQHFLWVNPKKGKVEQTVDSLSQDAPLYSTISNSILSDSKEEVDKDPPSSIVYKEFDFLEAKLVRITEEEYNRLVDDYWTKQAHYWMNALDLHLWSMKMKDPYSSHNLAMRKRMNKALVQKLPKKPKEKKEEVQMTKEEEEQAKQKMRWIATNLIEKLKS